MPRRPSSDSPRAVKRTAKRVRPRAARGDALEAALATLAHEIRTPLNSISVLAQLLATSGLPAPQSDWAEALKGAADHLASLTTVVVDGARAGVGKLAPRSERFDPAVLARSLAHSLEARAQTKGLACTSDIAADLPHAVTGDPVLIRAAVENLLDNAAKFTERGRLRLSAGLEPRSDGAASLHFTVTDEGIGMSPAELRRLFRPFAQANARIGRRYGGAGLGIAFARKVARAMGGDLTVESTPGAGSRFRFSAKVDMATAADEMAAGVEHAGLGSAAKALRLLCVEDNPYGRVVFKTMAVALGHQIDFAATGEAAIAAVEGGNYDVVLMDVTLPGISGVEATRRIRRLAGPQNRIPVVGVSGHGDPAGEQAARAAGMVGFLVKPVSPQALATALAVAVRR
jgi:CheY-like chemotaxis protein